LGATVAVITQPLCAQTQIPTAANRIALVANSDNETTTARVRAELESDGWQVVVVEQEALSLEVIAQANNAIAAIRIQANPPACEIWVPSLEADSNSSSEVIDGSTKAEAVLAIQAVEVLRARLLKIGIAAPKTTIPVTAPVPAPLRTELPRVSRVEHHPLWIGVGSWLLGSPGGFSPSVIAGITLSGPLWRHWILATRVWAPITAAEESQPQGTTQLWLLSTSGSLAYELGDSESIWNGRLHLGLGALLLHYRTEAIPPFEAHSPTFVTALNYVAFEVNRRLDSRLRIGIELSGGLSWPRPVLMVAGQNVAHWGRPYLAAGIQGEFDVAPYRVLSP
jgi:hypothetical protein